MIERTENLNNRVGKFVKKLLDKPVMIPKMLDVEYDYRNGYSKH